MYYKEVNPIWQILGTLSQIFKRSFFALLLILWLGYSAYGNFQKFGINIQVIAYAAIAMYIAIYKFWPIAQEDLIEQVLSQRIQYAVNGLFTLRNFGERGPMDAAKCVIAGFFTLGQGILPSVILKKIGGSLLILEQYIQDSMEPKQTGAQQATTQDEEFKYLEVSDLQALWQAAQQQHKLYRQNRRWKKVFGQSATTKKSA